MGVGYDFVNPAKKEYFNPAISGGYLRKPALFRGGLQLYALELLMCAELSDAFPKKISESLNSWHGDPLLVVAEYEWTYPHEEEKLTEDDLLKPNLMLISEYRDITRNLALYLTRTDEAFAEEYLPKISMDSKRFTDLALYYYEHQDGQLGVSLTKHFGNWEKKYQKICEKGKR